MTLVIAKVFLQLFLGWQLQGGQHQTLQVMQSPQRPAVISVQGNQEDEDRLQPALGWGALQ